jgi:hypothetical protein
MCTSSINFEADKLISENVHPGVKSSLRRILNSWLAAGKEESESESLVKANRRGHLVTAFWQNL